METRTTKTAVRNANINSAANFESETEFVSQRLEQLIALGENTKREEIPYFSGLDNFEAETMKNPLTTEKAVAYLGILLGIFPPAAIFAKIFLEGGNYDGGDLWILSIPAIVCMLSATTGYFSGKVVGKLVEELENIPWFFTFALAPFLGMLWGIISGGVGGVIIFIIGAVFGAGLGAAVGAAALPLFVIFHRFLKKGNLIERSQFLPIAFGVTFVICAFILGL